MKKKVLLLSLFVLSFVLFGCTFNNTPKAKVESLLMKYQKNTDTIKLCAVSIVHIQTKIKYFFSFIMKFLFWNQNNKKS